MHLAQNGTVTNYCERDNRFLGSMKGKFLKHEANTSF
jgi:hypothetical protein